MKKVLLKTASIIFLLVFLVSCSTTNKEKEIPILEGNWKQTNSQSSDSYQFATITGDTIEIYWVNNDGDSKSLYWSGDFVAPKTAEEPYVWESKNDHEKTDSALMASGDDTKKMTFENNSISYEASAFGTTTTVRLQKE